MTGDAVTYSGTGLTVVAGDRTIVLVGAEPDAALVRALWPVVREGAGLPQLIETFARHGMAGLPDFGLVSWIGTHATLLVRGRVGATAYLADGSREHVSGVGVTTWLERASPTPGTSCSPAPTATTRRAGSCRSWWASPARRSCPATSGRRRPVARGRRRGRWTT
ncbi:hypothetical protein ACFQX7_26555 [Luedemannella flava]